LWWLTALPLKVPRRYSPCHPYFYVRLEPIFSISTSVMFYLWESLCARDWCVFVGGSYFDFLFLRLFIFFASQACLLCSHYTLCVLPRLFNIQLYSYLLIVCWPYRSSVNATTKVMECTTESKTDKRTYGQEQRRDVFNLLWNYNWTDLTRLWK